MIVKEIVLLEHYPFRLTCTIYDTYEVFQVLKWKRFGKNGKCMYVPVGSSEWSLSCYPELQRMADLIYMNNRALDRKVIEVPAQKNTLLRTVVELTFLHKLNQCRWWEFRKRRQVYAWRAEKLKGG